MTRDTSSRLQNDQSKSLSEIGAYLRQVREAYYLSLDEIASKTMIQARLLQAIEDGKLEKLPEPVYIQGFIKLYADSLGLNGNEFADAFPMERQVRMAQQSSWKDTPAAQLRPLHLYVAYIVLIMTSVSLLSYVVNRSTPAGNPIASPIRTPQIASVGGATPPTTGQASPSPTRRPATATTTRSTNPDEPVRVDVTLTAQSWLRIVIDGETEFEGVLPEGTERTWTAKNQLTVRAGNAGGVMLAHNSGQSKQMGAPGAVEEQTFSTSQDAASLPDSELTSVR